MSQHQCLHKSASNQKPGDGGKQGLVQAFRSVIRMRIRRGNLSSTLTFSPKADCWLTGRLRSSSCSGGGNSSACNFGMHSLTSCSTAGSRSVSNSTSWVLHGSQPPSARPSTRHTSAHCSGAAYPEGGHTIGWPRCHLLRLALKEWEENSQLDFPTHYCCSKPPPPPPPPTHTHPDPTLISCDPLLHFMDCQVSPNVIIYSCINRKS
jgi:hypothetical protein